MSLVGYKVLLSQIKLYDTKVLQEKLGLKELKTLNDEQLCQAYAKLGNSLPLALGSDFSFVLYNAEKETYFCARDPLGIKSLYFTKIEDSYRFSSTVDELLKIPNVLKNPNLNAMRTMLYQRTVDYTETMYEGVYRLPPGHFMVIENGKERMERYWYPEKIKIDYAITENAAAKKLKVLFEKAVKNRISKLEETAFEVSGGLDSSSVVSILSQNILPSSIDSYSMDFKGLHCDEDEYIDSILENYALHHQKIPCDHLDYHHRYPLKHLYKMSPSWPITLTFAMYIPLFEQMKRDGKKIVISGQGGDHLFTGTSYVYYDLFRRFKFLALSKEFKTHKRPWNSIKVYIIKPILGEKGTHFVRILLGKKEISSSSLFEEKNKIKDLSDIAEVKNPAHKHDLDMLTMSAHSTMMDGNFFHCAENYFGIEYRHPFFDKELVEFALSLPPEMKYKGGTIKWILRKAMDGILPDKIRDRKDKAEFSELLIQQIDAIDLSKLLDDPYIAKLGLIEQSLIDKFRKEYEDKTVKYIVFLWTIINIEYWYRYNFEEESLPE